MRDILENSSFRFKPSSAYTFFEQNFHVAKTFVKDRFTSSGLFLLRLLIWINATISKE